MYMNEKESHELLTLAAKAAGKSGLYRNDTVHPEGFYCYSNDEYWNPRDNSGDAFELAMRKGLSINRGLYDGEWAISVGTLLATMALVPVGDDPVAAARLAILRAAAEIGRAMP